MIAQAMSLLSLVSGYVMSFSMGFGQGSFVDYLPVLIAYSRNAELEYGEMTMVSKDGFQYLCLSVMEDSQFKGYVLLDDEGDFVHAYLTSNEDSKTNSFFYPDHIGFPKTYGLEEDHEISIASKMTEQPFYVTDYPSVNENVSIYSWTDTGDYSQYFWLNNVPEYYWTVGCTPTSAAMFVSYLDRYCPDFCEIYAGELPLVGNSSEVDDLISTLGDYMGTNAEGRTLLTRVCGAIENFFRDQDIDDYYMKTSMDLQLYTKIVREAKLPVIMHMASTPGGTVDHTVLALGYVYRPTLVVPDIICHSTWESVSGNYFFPGVDCYEFDYVTNVGYL